MIKFLDYKRALINASILIKFLEVWPILHKIIIIFIIMHEYNNYNNDNRRSLINSRYFDLSSSSAGNIMRFRLLCADMLLAVVRMVHVHWIVLPLQWAST
jgi:hypothetical protein